VRDATIYAARRVLFEDVDATRASRYAIAPVSRAYSVRAARQAPVYALSSRARRVRRRAYLRVCVIKCRYASRRSGSIRYIAF